MSKLTHLSDNELLEYERRYRALISQNRRLEAVKRFSYDTKFSYHVVRLLCEVEQIMVEHDLDLERNSEQLKAIRRGEWTLEQLKDYFAKKETALEDVYSRSSLQHSPDEGKIKELLMKCLEQHYGNLSEAVVRNPSMDRLLNDLRTLVDQYSLPEVSEATSQGSE